MKKINVREIKNGDILSRPVIYSDGDVLIKEGVSLKEEYIPLLEQLEIFKIYIEDDLGKESSVIEKIRTIKEEHKKIIEQYVYKENQSLEEVGKISEELYDVISKNEIRKEILDEDTSLYMHLIQVAYFCGHISKKLKMQEGKIREIILAGLLHDIGLRYVTVNYINIKLNEFTPNEAFEFKKHTIYGYTALENEKWLDGEVKNIILSHHERLDGSGYPLKQKNQSLSCRIIQCVESYIGMLTGFETEKMEMDAALKNISDNIKKHYDEKIFEELFKI